MDAAVCEELLQSWLFQLSAERKSPNTIKAYGGSVRAYLRFCASAGQQPDLSKRQMMAFQISLQALGRESQTVLSRQVAVKRFSAWLEAEGEISADQLSGLKPTKLDEKVPRALTQEQIAALIGTCGGRAFHDLRDKAMVMLMADSMVRASELLAMTTADIDLKRSEARVRRGKGGRERYVAFGPKTAAATDRYLRARRRHPLAETPDMWLGARGREPLRYGGLYATLSRRAQRATPPFEMSPHCLRRSGAIAWREKGGSVPGLMTVAGWRSLKEVQRYVRSAETRLALEEAKRMFD